MSDYNEANKKFEVGIIRYISHLYFSGMHKHVLAVFDKVYSDLIKHLLVSNFKSIKR